MDRRAGQLQEGGDRAEAELAPQVVGVEEGVVGQPWVQGLDVGGRFPVGRPDEGREAGHGLDRQAQSGSQAHRLGLGRLFAVGKEHQVVVGVLEVGGVDDLLQEAAVGGDLLPGSGVLSGGHHGLDALQRLVEGVGARVGQQPKVGRQRGIEAGQLAHPGPQLSLGELGQVEGADLEGESLRHGITPADRGWACPRRRGW